MKTVRLYYDKDAEEAWLNAMARDGWAFRHFFLGVYTFAPVPPVNLAIRLTSWTTGGGIRRLMPSLWKRLGFRW
jgi:hypothetical protein